MAGSGAIKAGRAFVEIFADDTRLQRGLARAQARLKAFGSAVMQMGKQLIAASAAVVGALTGAVLLFSKIGDAMAKMAARTGLSVEAISALAFAADQSGTALEDLESGLRAMARVIEDAASGGTAGAEALAKLGLTAEQLLALSPEDRFKLIADRLAQIEDPTLRAALAMEIFGKSGTKLLPLLANGAAGIDELMKKARRLGLVMDAETARKAEILNDALGAMWMTLKQIAINVGSALAPIFTGLADSITELAALVGGFIKNNMRLVQTILVVAGVVGTLGAGLVALAAATKVIAFALVPVAGGLTVVKGLLGALVGIVTGLISPAGLLAGVFAAMGAALLTHTSAGANALAWLATQFHTLRDVAEETIGGIIDALASGDVKLAAEVFWAGLSGAFEVGQSKLMKKWNELQFFILDSITTLASGFGIAWQNIIELVANAVAELRGLFDETFDVAAAKAENARRRREALLGLKQADELERLKALEILEERDADVDRELNRSLRRLKESRDKARRQREQREIDPGAPPSIVPFEPQPIEIPDLVSNLIEQAQVATPQIEKRLEVRGTFNARAIQGLQAADADGHKGTQDLITVTNDYLARIFREIRDEPGLLFE